MYLDTSILVEYWMTEGMEMPETGMNELARSARAPGLPRVSEMPQALTLRWEDETVCSTHKATGAKHN